MDRRTGSTARGEGYVGLRLSNVPKTGAEPALLSLSLCHGLSLSLSLQVAISSIINAPLFCHIFFTDPSPSSQVAISSIINGPLFCHLLTSQTKGVGPRRQRPTTRVNGARAYAYGSSDGPAASVRALSQASRTREGTRTATSGPTGASTGLRLAGRKYHFVSLRVTASSEKVPLLVR